MEPFQFTAEQKAVIMQTAIMAAGPGAGSAEINDAISRVAFLMSPGSLANSAIGEVERRYEKVLDWKFITGTLLYVDREERSGRGIIVTTTKPSEHNQNTGQELVRTGPTQWDPIAKSLAQDAIKRIGEAVTMLVAIEKMDNGNKVRVVHDIRFRGPDASFQQVPVRWDVLGGGGKPFDTSKLVGVTAQLRAQQGNPQ